MTPNHETNVDHTWPMYLKADELEVKHIMQLWNAIAPRPKDRINPKYPGRIGAKEAKRIDLLVNAVRNARAQSALYAGQRCLQIVQECETVPEAVERLVEIVGQPAD